MHSRRTFLRNCLLATGGAAALRLPGWAAELSELPVGGAPPALEVPHFASRLQAFLWRNWQLVPARRMGEVVRASARDMMRLGRSRGLAGPPKITVAQQRRAALTIIKRNWHLLPYDQLLQLLGWTADEMAFTLREDDFLYVKLGNLKPQCEPLRYQPPEAAARATRLKEQRTSAHTTGNLLI